MRARRVIAAMLLCFLAAPGAASASQTPKAAWKITSTSLPTNFAPGSEGALLIIVNNVGAKASEGQVRVTDLVPGELEILEDKISVRSNDFGAADPECTVDEQLLTCTDGGPIRPGYQLEVRIAVKAPSAPPSPPAPINQASVSGGGAEGAATSSAVVVDSEVARFDFLSGSVGFDAPLTDPDGAATEQAGSHPYQLNLDFGFPTKQAGNSLSAPEHLHDASVDLPRGLIINPAATTQLCTEAELVSDPEPGCPAASQVGTVAALTFAVAGPEAQTTALYNMVPPPGQAAALGFDALGVGIFVHLLGGVRSDGDYGISGGGSDFPALPVHPVFGARVSLWGNPTDESHDGIRGACAPPSTVVQSCTTPRTDIALLSLPGECSGAPLEFSASAHSWEALGAPPIIAKYTSAGLAGEAVQMSGCDALDFAPSISVRPTTNFADSPSGLDVTLSQAQDLSMQGDSPSPLRDARVTLPAGMSANAAQADGLAVCSSAQIGLRSGVGGSPVRLSKNPDSCPDAAKLGTVEVQTPLLAQIDEEDNVVRDPEGNPVPRPLHGSLYLAKPFDNPFNSLLALYIVVNDPRSGVIAKFVGKVEPDPLTGRLSTRFTENPQLPLQQIHLHLFPGSRAPLQTPLTCGGHTTATTMTPWSSPFGADTHPSDAFAITASPSPGPCPASEGQAPYAPAFSAGTVSPRAATYSPLVLRLSREDGSQRLARIDTTLPKGLIGKLAGVGLCSDAQIAAAKARSNPEEGKLERASPSCPASSFVGTVTAGAGVGPSPVYLDGRTYLAGPYAGAPLSAVVITPAVAGPFDLGTVVVRTALYVNPDTAQVRALSDPLPQILQGIPADVRSVALRLDRNQFSLNPTSCDSQSFTGAATSALGQVATLSSRFQVGGCEGLPFKPKLALRLRGGTHRGSHPAFRAVLSARGGDANIASASLTLPHSEFIDQAHFRTICTRVQFSARQCPSGAIYGHAKVLTPLLDYPLEGPVYLRSSSHELPDVVAALHGPAYQPVEFDLVGRVDSVGGGLRTRFESTPDAPFTKAIVSMQGGKKGLFQNSTNICRGINRATLRIDGQNGKTDHARPLLKIKCKGKGGKKSRRAGPRH
jgi:hypothetical protein